jgi:hypothetical protein
VGFVRHDHVDPGDTSEPAHQIEVGGPQAAGIRRPIRHRNHDVGERKIGLPVDEQAPEHVLVHRPARRHAAFVAEKREAEEAGLMDQTLAAAIRPALDAQLIEQGSREAPDGALTPVQLVVQVEHRGNQARSQLKWRSGHPRARRGRPRRRGKQQLTLDPAQERRGARQRDVEAAHPFVTGQQIRQDDRAAARGNRGAFDRLAQQLGRRARRDDDHATPRLERLA